MSEFGLLSARVLATHCVWLDDAIASRGMAKSVIYLGIVSLLSASVEISLVYRVTSPLEFLLPA